MTQLVSLARHHTAGQSVAVVTVDHPPVNAQSQAVRQGLMDAIAAAIADADIAAIVLRGAGATFAAGADLSELKAFRLDPPSPHDLHALVEGSPKPVIAALHGTVLGGGTELALACHYRVAAAGCAIGLPEIKLGLLPGGGGTQRLSRLIGAARALDMMLSGAPMPTAEAVACGLVDLLAEGEVTEAAVAFAGGVPGPRRTLERMVDPASLPPEGLAARLEAERAKQGLAMAPALIVACVEAAVSMPPAEGLAFELARFKDCLASPQAAALLHLFFAERAAARVSGLPASAAARSVKSAGVIGSGTMGAGIAVALLQAGLSVTVVEQSPAALEAGMGRIAGIVDGLVARGRLSPAKGAAARANLAGALDLEAVAGADLLIEAVFESMAVKVPLMQRLGAVCKPGAIIATNTSTLDVDALAAASGRAADVVGLHFFSPAHVMRLLEIVRGRDTAPGVLLAALGLAKRLRKVPVVSGVCFGFIGNRMLEGYLRETDALVLQGVEPQRIDRVMEGFGFAMGPCRMMDMAGIDLGGKLVRESQSLGVVPSLPSYRAMIQALHDAGRLGQKNGLGYYKHDGRTPTPDPEVAVIATRTAAALGVAQTAASIDDDTILARCLLPLINEAARILEEGIAQRPGDIDVVWTTGYGFPALRGGPLHHADALGLDTVVARLQALAAADGNAHGGWSVAPLLARLAAEGRRFSDLT